MIDSSETSNLGPTLNVEGLGRGYDINSNWERQIEISLQEWWGKSI